MTPFTFTSAMRGRALVGTPLRRLRTTIGELQRQSGRMNAMLRVLVVSSGIALACLALSPRETSVRAAVRAAPVQGTSEYDLKAQFLFRFATPYVKWPEAAFAEKTSPFIVAVLGKDPFGKKLDELLKDKKVGEHPIKIVRFAAVDALESCHMLFVPGSQEKQLEKIAKFAKDKPILIVAESEAAAQNGAHIGFFVEKAHLGFAIHSAAAKQVKLEISSELLKLARLVDKSERDG